jgi:hypothetical protein
MRHKLADVQHHPAFAKHQMLESGSGAIHLRAQAEMLSALRTDTPRAIRLVALPAPVE